MKMKFKYLQTKNSRRRGIALEMAIFVMVLCFGFSILIVTTTMIHKNNYNRIVVEQTEKLELERIGAEFCVAFKNDDIPLFMWKVAQETKETEYQLVWEESNPNKLIIKGKISELTIEIEKEEDIYTITSWELK